MPNLVTRNLQLEDLQSIGGLLLRKLGLSSDELALLQSVLNDEAVVSAMQFEIASLSFKEGRKIPTDLEGVDLSLSAEAAAGLSLGFFPAGENIVLAGFTLPDLHRAQRTSEVPPGHLACGLELMAKLGAGADVASGTGWKFALSATGSMEARLKFFKVLPAVGARTALIETLDSLSTPFNVVSQPLQEGEVVVAEYHGVLKLGASFDYGWNTSGTKKLGTGLDNLELAAEYQVAAKLGATASFNVEDQVAVIVRPTGLDNWANVSFMKLRERETGLTLNLSVDAKLNTKTLGSRGQTQDVGAFVDSLLGRTPIPNVMSELKKSDTREEIENLASDAVDELVDRVVGEVRGVLEGPVDDIDAFLKPVRDKAAELVAAYQEFDADVRGFLENALEKLDALSEVDEAIEAIAAAPSAADLLDLLDDSESADKIRSALGILSRTLGFDVSQVSWLSDNFQDLKKLAIKITGLESNAKAKFEEGYGWLKEQLYIEEVIKNLETINESTVKDLLDKKILWLETYLSDSLNLPIDDLLNHLDPAIEILEKLTSGYDGMVAKAKSALEKTLNQEIGLRASLAWSSVSSKQALVSVDLNLDQPAGRAAMKDLMRGNVSDVMRDRLVHAGAIRFQKSYFLDEWSRSLSLRLVFNGKEDLRVKTALVTQSVVIEPTENGEIWVQESSAQAIHERSNRRAYINANTLFQVSFQESFVRRGQMLLSEGTRLGNYDISYSFRKEIRRADRRGLLPITADVVISQLEDVLDGIALEVVEPDLRRGLFDGLSEIGKLGELRNGTIDIRMNLAPDALYSVFAVTDSDSLQASVQAAWDRAVISTYGDSPALLRFYERFKNDAGGVPQWGTLEARPLNRIEWNDAFNLINSRGTFSLILRKLHHSVFQAIRAGDSLSSEVRDRLQKKLRKGLRKLASKMRWINGFEHQQSDRDFTMTVFSNMVDRSDRSGSIVVTYTHPIIEETMTLRADEDPPDLEDED